MSHLRLVTPDFVPFHMNGTPVVAGDWFKELTERLMARFGDNQPKGGVINTACVKHVADTLTIDTYGRGDSHNAPTTVGGKTTEPLKQSGQWNRPHPFPSDWKQIAKAIKDASITEIIIGDKSDPFMWMDSKYNMSKNLLKELIGKPCKITIRTRSDLIAHEDYIRILQGLNVTVQMVFSDCKDDQEARLIEPGAPSRERRYKAIGALNKAGIKVEMVTHKVPKYALKKVGLL